MNSFWKEECVHPSFKGFSKPLMLLRRSNDWCEFPFEFLSPWRGMLCLTQHVAYFTNIKSFLRLYFWFLSIWSFNWVHTLCCMLTDWFKAYKNLFWASEFSCLQKFSKSLRLTEHPMVQKVSCFFEVSVCFIRNLSTWLLCAEHATRPPPLQLNHANWWN